MILFIKSYLRKLKKGGIFKLKKFPIQSSIHRVYLFLFKTCQVLIASLAHPIRDKQRFCAHCETIRIGRIQLTLTYYFMDEETEVHTHEMMTS